MDEDSVRYDVRQEALRVWSLPFQHLIGQLEMLLHEVVVESALGHVFMDVKRTFHVKFVALRPTSTVLIALQLGFHRKISQVQESTLSNTNKVLVLIELFAK